MANDLVVKSNTLINATHYLSLVEQRLIGLAITKLRQVEIAFLMKSCSKLGQAIM